MTLQFAGMSSRVYSIISYSFLENGWKQSLVSNLPYRNKILVLMVKNYAKWHIKVSWPCPILLDFLNCFINFACDWLCKQFYFCISSQSSEKFNIFISFMSQSLFQTFDANIKWGRRAKVLNWTIFFLLLFFLFDLGQKSH